VVSRSESILPSIPATTIEQAMPMKSSSDVNKAVNDNTGSSLRICMAQMCSRGTITGNVELAHKAFDAALSANVDMLCFPEVSNLMQDDLVLALPQVVSVEEDRFVQACKVFALQSGIWVQSGSQVIKAENSNRFVNRSLMINGSGEIVSAYDKIHLFDIDLPNGTRVRESDKFDAGTKAVSVDTPWGRMGHAICYDLRFPHLFNALANAGARVLFIPAAFTVPTGKAHWEILLRARAIETGSFVIAAAQCGLHEDGRRTWGHSMAIDPWGKILAQGSSGPENIIIDLDLSKSAKTRANIPALKHAREFTQD